MIPADQPEGAGNVTASEALGSDLRETPAPRSRREPTLETFSPREVQARVRSGESAESVAADTGWDLAKVLRYAEPLLDERAFMAQQGSTVEVRRSGGGVTLAESCVQQLGPESADALVWDSYRREDGKWIVTAAVPRQGTAAWTYDHHGRNLHPLDDLARALMGAAPVAGPDVTDEDIAAALDLTATVSVVRDVPVGRPRLVAVEDAVEDTDDATDSADEAVDVDETDGFEDVASDGSPDRGGSGSSYEQETITLPREATAQPAADSRSSRKPRGRKGRTSIPSWDEILFGAGRTED